MKMKMKAIMTIGLLAILSMFMGCASSNSNYESLAEKQDRILREMGHDVGETTNVMEIK